jgi:hypothetical protein
MPAVSGSLEHESPSPPSEPQSARRQRSRSPPATTRGLDTEIARLTPAERGRYDHYLAGLFAVCDLPDEITREYARQAACAAVMLERIEDARRAHPRGAMSAPAIRLFHRQAPRYQRRLAHALDLLTLFVRRTAPTPENARNELPIDLGGSSHP